MNLQTTITAYLTACEAKNLSARTIKWYAWILSSFAAEIATETIITAETIETHLAKLHRRRLSPHTLADVHRCLAIFFSWCVQRHHLAANPCDLVSPPRTGTPAIKTITVDDAALIIRYLYAQACDPHATPQQFRDYALVLTLYDTGLRAAELCNLDLNDLDLANRLITAVGKGRKTRSVIISTTTATALRAWLATRSHAPGPLFPSSHTGQHLTPAGLTHLLQRVAQKAGITGRCNPHAWRHGLAREYLQNGGNLVMLADQLGHADIRTTSTSYARFAVAERRRAHDLASPIAHLNPASTPPHPNMAR